MSFERIILLSFARFAFWVTQQKKFTLLRLFIFLWIEKPLQHKVYFLWNSHKEVYLLTKKEKKDKISYLVHWEIIWSKASLGFDYVPVSKTAAFLAQTYKKSSLCWFHNNKEVPLLKKKQNDYNSILLRPNFSSVLYSYGLQKVFKLPQTIWYSPLSGKRNKYQKMILLPECFAKNVISIWFIHAGICLIQTYVYVQGSLSVHKDSFLECQMFMTIQNYIVAFEIILQFNFCLIIVGQIINCHSKVNSLSISLLVTRFVLTVKGFIKTTNLCTLQDIMKVHTKFWLRGDCAMGLLNARLETCKRTLAS